MIACATGCTLRARHLDTCTDTDCRGCLPRPAEDGSTVCLPCEGRWTEALGRAHDLITHIRSLVEPSPHGPDQAAYKHTKGASAPAPLNVAAVADADDLHATLSSWAVRVVEESGMTGPTWAGSDIRPASKRTVYGEPAYTDARVVGIHPDGETATQNVAEWLLTHKTWALNRDWTADMVQEVTATVGKLRNRWATEERPARLPVGCPSCGERALTRYAPACFMAASTITCDTCEETIPEALYAWHARRITDEKRAQRAAVARAMRAAS